MGDYRKSNFVRKRKGEVEVLGRDIFLKITFGGGEGRRRLLRVSCGFLNE